MKLSFTVPGPPVGKERPRRSPARPGHRAHFYTPEKTRNYEHKIALMAMTAKRKLAKWPMDAQYAIGLCVAFAGSTGDWDNVLKAVADACQGILYDNDKQLMSFSGSRHFNSPIPRIDVEIETIWICKARARQDGRTSARSAQPSRPDSGE